MFYFDTFEGKKVLKSDLLKDYNCFFTTREFVLTPGSMPELKTVAEKNRKLLENKLNGKIYTAVQTHGTNSGKVEKGIYLYDDTDALISDNAGDMLLLNFADCVPVILYDKTTNTGAVIHAGRRGTAKEIVYKTVKRLNDEFKIKSRNITALIGPCISKCCYEVDEDVFLELVKDTNRTDLYEKKGNKYFPDLKKLNYIQLKNSGVENIDICDYCTSCMSGIFFSYRKENGVCARHSAVVQIKG